VHTCGISRYIPGVNWGSRCQLSISYINYCIKVQVCICMTWFCPFVSYQEDLPALVGVIMLDMQALNMVIWLICFIGYHWSWLSRSFLPNWLLLFSKTLCLRYSQTYYASWDLGQRAQSWQPYDGSSLLVTTDSSKRITWSLEIYAISGLLDTDEILGGTVLCRLVLAKWPGRSAYNAWVLLEAMNKNL